MNSTTESSGTSAHLSSVKELLSELDQMKNKGVGARDRLDFILEQGSNLIDEFDLQDAFDVEARARSKRLNQLNELSSVMTNAEHLWAGGPILDDVKEAASKLFTHLRRFLKDTLSREAKSEINMLSQIWESAPDIRWLYPWLTAWEGPIYRPHYDNWLARTSGREYPPAPVPEEPSAEVKELAERKAKLYEESTPKAELERITKHIELPTEEEQLKEMKKLWPETPEKDWAELEQRHNAELERLNKNVLESPSPEDTHLKASEQKADWEKETHDLDQGRSPIFKAKILREEGDAVGEGKVVGTVSKAKDFEPEKEEDVVDHLLHDEWTVALRELTLDRWHFSKETVSLMGPVKRTNEELTETARVLLWLVQTGEARLELTPKGDKTHVSLRILTDGKLRKHEEDMSSAGVKELHLNPIPFVKKALDS